MMRNVDITNTGVEVTFSKTRRKPTPLQQKLGWLVVFVFLILVAMTTHL